MCYHVFTYLEVLFVGKVFFVYVGPQVVQVSLPDLLRCELWI